MSIVRTATWLVAVALAICVGLASFTITNQVKAPARAYALGFFTPGIARANVATSLYKSHTLKNPKAAVTATEQNLAKRAYIAEPLSSNALAVLIKAMGGSADNPQRQLLLDLAGKITRRNPLISAELIQAAAARDNQADFFLWMSRSVLTNNDLRNAYVGAMATVTQRDGAVAALTPIVGRAPRWADYYWKQVAQNSPSLLNAAKLRLAVARAPWRQSEITTNDKNLVLALANSGRFDAAQQLVRGLTKSTPAERKKSNFLVNGQFTRQPELPPFDWRLSALGTLGASIDEGDKSLLISAIGGASGIAASQLLQLTPGRYDLSWTLSTDTPIDPATLTARVYCAETGVPSQRPLPVPLTAGKKKSSLVIMDSTCRWYWFNLYAVLPDNAAGIDAYLRDVSLVPAADAEAKSGS